MNTRGHKTSPPDRLAEIYSFRDHEHYLIRDLRTGPARVPVPLPLLCHGGPGAQVSTVTASSRGSQRPGSTMPRSERTSATRNISKAGKSESLGTVGNLTLLQFNNYRVIPPERFLSKCQEIDAVGCRRTLDMSLSSACEMLLNPGFRFQRSALSLRITVYRSSQLGPARRFLAGPFEKKGGKYIPPPKF